ncbi:hypothetical protein SeLEV6574_g05806 [Synchytrium endobioticum]|nr:hypothetical protein SeLEV6574_g05806 [Synchytrium endobioticum]
MSSKVLSAPLPMGACYSSSACQSDDENDSIVAVASETTEAPHAQLDDVLPDITDHELDNNENDGQESEIDQESLVPASERSEFESDGEPVQPLVIDTPR